jgi:hypothetical protein
MSFRVSTKAIGETVRHSWVNPVCRGEMEGGDEGNFFCYCWCYHHRHQKPKSKKETVTPHKCHPQQCNRPYAALCGTPTMSQKQTVAVR